MRARLVTPKGGYRTKLFLATFAIAAASLGLAAAVLTFTLRGRTYERIERGLVNETRLSAALLAHRTEAVSSEELNAEAHALAGNIDARVTLIGPDGHVVGDSTQDDAALTQLENHNDRPEVIQAKAAGIGIARRASTTLGIDMLYVAVPVRHPSIAIVRLALPLTEIDHQLRTIWSAAAYAVGLSAIGAFLMAWLTSTLLVRRLQRLAGAAQRYAAGERPSGAADREPDEIGTVARVLDEAVQQLGKRAAELSRDRARFEAVLAGMVEGVLVIDAADRIELVNAAARRLLRIDGDARGRHYLECVRHPLIVAQLEAVRGPHGGTPPDSPVIREGNRAFISRTAPVGGVEGRGAVLVLHDVTDLQRTDQIRRDFVANISHELRTPLTAIRGYVEALLDGSIKTDELRTFLEIIARHSARMERLVKDLLRLARLEAGQQVPEYGSCDLLDLFAGVVADHRQTIDGRHQRVTWSVDDSVGAIVTDGQQLGDALRNLVENAIVYSPEASNITISAYRTGDDVSIAVADEGPGIPDADLTRVFERFYRVDKARARDSGGTGLGLSIVRHLVGLLHGKVSVQNRSTGGAVFTITIPAQPAAGR